MIFVVAGAGDVSFYVVFVAADHDVTGGHWLSHGALAPERFVFVVIFLFFVASCKILWLRLCRIFTDA